MVFPCGVMMGVGWRSKEGVMAERSREGELHQETLPYLHQLADCQTTLGEKIQAQKCLHLSEHRLSVNAVFKLLLILFSPLMTQG